MRQFNCIYLVATRLGAGRVSVWKPYKRPKPRARYRKVWHSIDLSDNIKVVAA